MSSLTEACVLFLFISLVSSALGKPTDVQVFPQGETFLLPLWMQTFVNGFVDTVESALSYPFRTLGQIFDAVFHFVGKYLDSSLEFKQKWIFKYVDSIDERIVKFLSTIGPAILRGFILVFIPNLDEVGINAGNALLDLIKTGAGLLGKLANPLNFIPGYSWVSGMFGGGSKAPSSAGTTSTATEKPSGILGWFG